ncbi:hypothetical protein ABZ345_36315 [Lentzea sp. NPDC005914]|uniref:hypothetical protein n=1 Tax=Lentzea sp. NPDC005914 TaxID=3154572 RepID=UPI0033D3D0CA
MSTMTVTTKPAVPFTARMRWNADREPETTPSRPAAQSGTPRFPRLVRTADSIVALQRLTGNRAASVLLQRQPQDRSESAQAAAQQRVLGGPASVGGFTVVPVSGQDVPAPDGLTYPAVPAPDRDYSYANYHRVRYLTMWVLSRIGPWTQVPGDDSWQRELEWGRLRLAASETWLIRKRWFWDTTMEVRRGTIYLSSEPFATATRRQAIAPPPAANRNWQPDQGAPLLHEHAPEDAPGEAVARQAARLVTTWMFTANAVRAASGQAPVQEPGAVRSIGGLFVLQSMIRAAVADNALMSSVFDQNALWVRSTPAPGSR